MPGSGLGWGLLPAGRASFPGPRRCPFQPHLTFLRHVLLLPVQPRDVPEGGAGVEDALQDSPVVRRAHGAPLCPDPAAPAGLMFTPPAPLPPAASYPGGGARPHRLAGPAGSRPAAAAQGDRLAPEPPAAPDPQAAAGAATGGKRVLGPQEEIESNALQQ